MNKNELIAFEEEIAEIYKTGVIKGPIHLRDGNEDALISIFKNIKPEDYKFATWANHLEALLSGVPREKVKARILEGRSMAMNFSEHRFYTSAIVGGICPIALGTAWAIKRRKGTEKVHIFIGDMTLHCGITHECIKYGIYNDLPIKWYVADNRKSVDTPTRDAWNQDNGRGDYLTDELTEFYNKLSAHYNANYDLIKHYWYTSKWPHSGTGVFLAF